MKKVLFLFIALLSISLAGSAQSNESGWSSTKSKGNGFRGGHDTFNRLLFENKDSTGAAGSRFVVHDDTAFFKLDTAKVQLGGTVPVEIGTTIMPFQFLQSDTASSTEFGFIRILLAGNIVYLRVYATQ